MRKRPATQKKSSKPVHHTAVLGPNNYGKSRVRLLKVARRGKRHTIHELSVDIALSGDFDAIHTDGDNALCLPTDTMKNTVYALGKDHPIDSIESFALHLARHFVSRQPQVSTARVRISQIGWERLVVGGHEHPHAFSRGPDEKQVCEATVARDGASLESRVQSGIEGLVILKSTDSAFSGFLKDDFTTLPETRDRIFCTSLTATWNHAPASLEHPDFEASREQIRRALIDTFATHKSESVQHTLFHMARAALAHCKRIDQVRLSMPNKHCLLVNLKPFDLENHNEIFVPTDEPHGLIEATVRRG